MQIHVCKFCLRDTICCKLCNMYWPKNLIYLLKYDKNLGNAPIYIWASTRENLSSGVCEQQRHRSSCAFAQSDQHLCYSFIGKFHYLELAATSKISIIWLISVAEQAGLNLTLYLKPRRQVFSHRDPIIINWSEFLYYYSNKYHMTCIH